MRKLVVFNMVSLDGFFVDSKGDMSWAHKHDAEWNAFVNENASGSGVLVFGRITYELMASYWPTPMALQNSPVVAKGMNDMPKNEHGPNMVILGSGNIVSQLAQQNLIYEYQVALRPIVLGKGRTMFEGVKDKLNLQLTKSRTFGNGTVFTCYQPMA